MNFLKFMSNSSYSSWHLSRRSFIRYSALATASALVSAGCDGLGRQTQKEPLRLGSQLWAGFMPWKTAEEKGFFKQNDIQVNLTWVESLTQLNTDLAAGKFDAASLTTSDLYQVISQGGKFKAVLATDFSSGADAIITTPEIKALKELADKKAEVELGSVGHLLYLQALDAGGVPQNQAELVNTLADVAVKNLVAGKAQVIYAYEPFVGQALSSGKGKAIFSSKDVPGLITDLLIVNQKTIDEQPETVEKLVKTWYDTLNYRNQNLQEVLSIEAKQAGVSVEEYQRILQGLVWLTPEKAAATFREGYNTESLLISGRTVANFLEEQKVIETQLPGIETLIDDSFIKKYLET